MTSALNSLISVSNKCTGLIRTALRPDVDRVNATMEEIKKSIQDIFNMGDIKEELIEENILNCMIFINHHKVYNKILAEETLTMAITLLCKIKGINVNMNVSIKPKQNNPGFNLVNEISKTTPELDVSNYLIHLAYIIEPEKFINIFESNNTFGFIPLECVKYPKTYPEGAQLFVSQNIFMERLQQTSKLQLEHINHPNICLSGSFMLSNLLQAPFTIHSNDVDIFILNSDTDTFKKMVNYYKETSGCYNVIENNLVTTLVCSGYNLQFILSTEKDGLDLVRGFDLDVCKFYYNNHICAAAPEAISAIRHYMCTIDIGLPRYGIHNQVQSRLLKYYSKGFGLYKTIYEYVQPFRSVLAKFPKIKQYYGFTENHNGYYILNNDTYTKNTNTDKFESIIYSKLVSCVCTVMRFSGGDSVRTCLKIDLQHQENAELFEDYCNYIRTYVKSKHYRITGIKSNDTSNTLIPGNINIDLDKYKAEISKRVSGVEDGTTIKIKFAGLFTTLKNKMVCIVPHIIAFEEGL